MTFYLRFGLLLIVALLTFQIAIAQTQSTADPLVQVLVSKGVLTTEEARLITANASPAEQRDRLATLLRDKGVISASEFEAVRAVAPEEDLAIKTMNADYKTAPPRADAAPQPSPPRALRPKRLPAVTTTRAAPPSTATSTTRRRST